MEEYITVKFEGDVEMLDRLAKNIGMNEDFKKSLKMSLETFGRHTLTLRYEAPEYVPSPEEMASLVTNGKAIGTGVNTKDYSVGTAEDKNIDRENTTFQVTEIKRKRKESE